MTGRWYVRIGNGSRGTERDYLKRSGTAATPKQIDALVLAFELAMERLPSRPAGSKDPLRDKLARTVVDLVLINGLTDPEIIGKYALNRLGQGRRASPSSTA